MKEIFYIIYYLNRKFRRDETYVEFYTIILLSLFEIFFLVNLFYLIFCIFDIVWDIENIVVAIIWLMLYLKNFFLYVRKEKYKIIAEEFDFKYQSKSMLYLRLMAFLIIIILLFILGEIVS